MVAAPSESALSLATRGFSAIFPVVLLATAFSVAIGYLTRFDDGQLISRFIQQFNLLTQFRNLKLGHRFLIDETFRPNAKDQWRLRYRLSGLIPFSGQSIDPTEWYLKLQNEYINIFIDGYNLEIRGNIFLGYKFNDANKIEFGIDNRFRNLIKSGSSIQSWFGVYWYLAI